MFAGADKTLQNVPLGTLRREQVGVREPLIKCGAGALAREKPAYLYCCLVLGDPCSRFPSGQIAQTNERFA